MTQTRQLLPLPLVQFSQTGTYPDSCDPAISHHSNCHHSPFPDGNTTSMANPPARRSLGSYISPSGDSLEAVAQHFGCKCRIFLDSQTAVDRFVKSGHPPHYFQSPFADLHHAFQQIIPDSEVVYSPSSQSFNIESYVNSSGEN